MSHAMTNTTSTTGKHGDLGGTIGNALPALKMLELLSGGEK